MLPGAEAVNIAAAENAALQQQVGHIAQHHTAHGLPRHQQRNGADRHGGIRQGGEQNGQHLVRGGEEHRQHGADGNRPGGKQAGRRGGNAALGHDAQQTAHQRAGLAGIAQNLIFIEPLAALQQLHQQVGDK